MTATGADTPDADSPEFRSFAPRRSLPSGRAVVGAVLIAAAALGAFALGSREPADRREAYIVLRNDIDAGDPVSLADVSIVEADLPEELAAHAVRTTDGIEGSIALRLLRAGELLDRRAVSSALSIDGETVAAMHELTLPVPRTRTPHQVRRGDRVTVLANTGGQVLTAIEDALVLSYVADGSHGVRAGEGVLTVALTESELVARAALLSENPEDLTIVLTSRVVDHVYPAFYAIPSPTDGDDATIGPVR